VAAAAAAATAAAANLHPHLCDSLLTCAAICTRPKHQHRLLTKQLLLSNPCCRLMVLTTTATITSLLLLLLPLLLLFMLPLALTQLHQPLPPLLRALALLYTASWGLLPMLACAGTCCAGA
jgi:hypothetical protein